MSNLFQIGATDSCGGFLPIVKVLANVIKLIQIIVPIGLIIFGTIDLGKAVIVSEEKDVKAAQSRLIKRFIYAALIFFVPIVVNAVMNLIATGGEGDTAGWYSCWQAANK